MPRVILPGLASGEGNSTETCATYRYDYLSLYAFGRDPRGVSAGVKLSPGRRRFSPVEARQQ